VDCDGDFDVSGVGSGGVVVGIGFAEGGAGVVSLFEGFARDAEFGEALFPLVELLVEDADLADVAGLEAEELVAEMGEVGLALGEDRAECGEVSAAVSEFEFFRGDVAEDGGHWVLRNFHSMRVVVANVARVG
jgi:hypothetical protein